MPTIGYEPALPKLERHRQHKERPDPTEHDKKPHTELVFKTSTLPFGICIATIIQYLQKQGMTVEP